MPPEPDPTPDPEDATRTASDPGPDADTDPGANPRVDGTTAPDPSADPLAPDHASVPGDPGDDETPTGRAEPEAAAAPPDDGHVGIDGDADRASPDRPVEAPGFAGLGLRDELVAALAGLGYEEPTPIQGEAIPPLVEGRDLLGQAATGTGKTAAFALPLLQRLPGHREDRPAALILVPTRELAVQVSEAVHRYGRGLGARVLPLYGGQPIVRQLRSLRQGVDVVVATPGRAIDHLGRGSLDLGGLAVVVLDEADEMLDMGFAEDIDAILGAAPEGRQTVLFSATMPARINSLARRHLRDPVHIRIDRQGPAAGEAPQVRQSAFLVRRAHKPVALGRLLDVEAPTATLVFCRTRDEVDQLTDTLNGRGYRAEALHGGMSQEQRDRVMGRMRAGTAELLVATDVAARGLDLDQLTHVINYDVPSGPEAYTHRVGRVGRAGREGVALTLAEPREHRMLKTIERVTGQRIPVEQVPTVADLRARQLELTRNALQEALADGGLDHFRVVVEALADEFDVMEVALAAVKLAHRATSPEVDEPDIPPVAEHPDGPARRERPGRDRGDRGRDRPAGDRTGRPGRVAPDRGRERSGRDRRDGPPAGRDRPGKAAGGAMTRLYVSAGRNAGIRPADLVGAIANETSLVGRDIGSIEITDRFSLVDVPTRAVDEVIAAVGRSTVKGKRVTVRRERY